MIEMEIITQSDSVDMELEKLELGTNDYTKLLNKPSINGIIINGDKTPQEYGLQPLDENYVHTDNNFTDEEKAKLQGLENYDDTVVKEHVQSNTNNIQALVQKDIEQDLVIENVRQIALGKTTGYVFDTTTAMEEWLQHEENRAKLKVGDALLIIEINVPDYWWDGHQPQQLETQKVDLSDYYKKEEIAIILRDYALKSDIKTKTSQLENDSNFVSMDTATQQKLVALLSKVTILGNDITFVGSVSATRFNDYD